MRVYSLHVNFGVDVDVDYVAQTGAVLYFNIPVDPLATMLVPGGPMARDQFLGAWQSVDDSREVSKEVRGRGREAYGDGGREVI